MTWRPNECSDAQKIHPTACANLGLAELLRDKGKAREALNYL